MVCDAQCRNAIGSNKNLLVAWFLMASYQYYILDQSLISDELFDAVCKELLACWDYVHHMHKHLLLKSDLEAGTGHRLKAEDYPEMVKNAATFLLPVAHRGKRRGKK